nr:DNA mismatch repair protein MLH1 [Cryptococcus depauperatus CBS 7841]
MQVNQDLGQDAFEPGGPKPIKKLTKDVINQIAAAEIIHRPSNAIKELLENSLDAGATFIKISVKDGGLKLLQITDNGHGINKDDLPLLCERYATSKLRKFEDLMSLGTYGFRGEALASISYCSHVEVVTKTKNEGCGWKALYQDGVLVPAKPGSSSDPKPAAANDGTIITASDLFYNMPLRKRAFKSTSEEYNRILDAVTKYAIHNPHVAWQCKKAGSALPDVSTQVNSTAKANIATLYTPAIANELLELKETVLQPEDKLGAKCRGWISNASSHWTRKGGWLLFINNRLVDSNKIRKAIELHYTAYLPKGASPWVYLSLDIDPAKIDVNVHPTKSQVHFLNEDEMIDAIMTVVSATLAGANVSRSFSVQTLLPGAPTPERLTPSVSSSSSSIFRKPAPNYKIRIDPSNRTLDSMVAVLDPSQLESFKSTEPQINEENERPAKRRMIETNEDVEMREQGSKEILESLCEFTSIQTLRKEVRKNGSPELNDIMRQHAYVGVVDRHLTVALIQHNTRLFVIDYASLAEEHFYQLSLRQFGAFNRIRLEPSPDLRDLLRLAVEDDVGLKEAGLEIDSVVDYVAGLLMDKNEMLDEYFSLSITENGKVETLPMVLKGYTPNLDRLPHFLLCLGTRVEWKEEKTCFETSLRELAFYYSPRPFDESSTDLPNPSDHAIETDQEVTHQLWQLEHVLFPSFRRYTSWPKDKLGDVTQVANLPDLFRIFERC